MDANDHLEEQLCMNEDCLCCVCVARQTWSGKRIYKFANYTYQKQSYVVKFTQDEWTQFSTLDSKGKYMLSKGYAGIVTREMRKSDCSCKERLRYVNDTSTEKPPRFLVETDATGGMCAPIKNLNCDKRIDNYAIVKSVGIPGDVSSKTVMSFGDMITNDHSSYNIGIFYREFKHKFEEEFKYWPPFDEVLVNLGVLVENL
ncbi:hypothetical protein RP20_CCG003732 [Aedes albopictus]|nr:hypothetical protein RP20_CCG003732 [Aedes albopictus]